MSMLKILAPLTVAAMMVVGATAGASAYQCKTTSEAVAATAASQGTAIMQGRAAWTGKVKGKHGLAWSVWSIAATPIESCTAAGGGFQCTVIAKPCLYVVP